VLNANGTVHSEARHYPYGEERWRWPQEGTFPTEYRFTGQRMQSGLGLFHMGARHYDPSLGRWISADTLVPNPTNPQSFNRYAYVRNSPLKFADPTGHMEDGECGPDGEQCQDDPLPIGEVVIGILHGMVDSIFDPARTEPIVISLDDSTKLVIMPVGSDPFQQRSADLQRGGEIFGTLGAAMDLFEIVGMVGGGGAELGAVFDVGIAAIGSALSGDMWLGCKPHPDLPPLVLAGQDVLVATGDLAVPWITGVVATGLTGSWEVGLGAKTMTDVGTTVTTGLYDLSRSRGNFPTIVNAGFSLEWKPQGYVLVYPGGN
jgi:RHS repeat-associated protein